MSKFRKKPVVIEAHQWNGHNRHELQQVFGEAFACEAMITQYEPFRLGIEGPRQCKNAATLQVTVKGQGKMLLCDACLPEFKKYATLPWTSKALRRGDQ